MSAMVPRLVVLNPSKRAEERLVGRTIVSFNLDSQPQRVILDDGLELLVGDVLRDEDGRATEIQLWMPPDDPGLN